MLTRFCSNHTPARKDCRAAIYFANPAFPPITYFYGSGSCHFGSENASFQVPISVPNGDAYVTWTCGAAAHMCMRANVSEGRGTLRAPQSQDGTISCQTWSQNGNTTLSASFHSVEGDSTTNTGRGTTSSTSTTSSTTSSTSITVTTAASPASSVVISEDQSIPRSNLSNTVSPSADGNGFVQVSTASRLAAPDIARGLVTVTRTVTTLFTTIVLSESR
ncbi:hypothetical protein M0657_009731 [Pyricularia oryzae]|nr:hypothetical protein M0657_009731 [Pyricularia oryzae]